MHQADDNTADDNTDNCIQANDTATAPLKTDAKVYDIYYLKCQYTNLRTIKC